MTIIHRGTFKSSYFRFDSTTFPVPLEQFFFPPKSRNIGQIIIWFVSVVRTCNMYYYTSPQYLCVCVCYKYICIHPFSCCSFTPLSRHIDHRRRDLLADPSRGITTATNIIYITSYYRCRYIHIYSRCSYNYTLDGARSRDNNDDDDLHAVHALQLYRFSHDVCVCVCGKYTYTTLICIIQA